jgi:hypothetical protein
MQHWPTYVDPRYADHLTQLAEIHLIETQEDLRNRKRTRREVRCWSGYFAVPKTDAKSRAIFSGGRVSSLCPPPPNVNLMTQPEVLRHVHDMLANTSGPLFFVEADLRHWFHQITAHEKLRMLFGLQMKPPSKQWYVWKCLPMGFSWSPAIAQACGWIYLLFKREAGKQSLFDLTPCQDAGVGLPKFVRTISRKSVAMVYYDNLLVISTDENEAVSLKTSILRNCKDLNVEIKGAVNFTKDKVVYLGMDILIRRDGSKSEPELLVRPAKIEKWAQSVVPERHSCREYASFVGRAMFTASLSNQNLQLSPLGRRAVKLARLIGRSASQHSWNHVIPCPPDLKEMWEDVMKYREEYSPCLREEAVPTAYTKIIATDASDRRYGVTVMDCQVRVVNSVGGKWSDGRHELLNIDVHAHIFYKELRAALYGLSTVPKGTTVLLIVDNAAVAWVLKNGFSKTDAANRLLEQHRDLLKRIYDVCLVVSADNPADCPSRDVTMEHQRVINLSRVINAFREGMRWASQRKEGEPWIAHRHVEPPETDGLGPAEVYEEEQ